MISFAHPEAFLLAAPLVWLVWRHASGGRPALTAMRLVLVVLAAALVAGPVMEGGTVGRDLVLLIDGSASTGYRKDVESVFERITSRAGVILGDLDGARGDRVNLIFSGSQPRALGWQDPEKARSLLSTLDSPTDEPLDLTAALGAVRELAVEEAGGAGPAGIEVRLLTDLQRNNFSALEGTLVEAPEGGEDQPEEQPLIVEHLDSLEELGVRVLVEDLGPNEDRPANLSVASVQPVERIWGPGARVEMDVLRGGRRIQPACPLGCAARATGDFGVLCRGTLGRKELCGGSIDELRARALQLAGGALRLALLQPRVQQRHLSVGADATV